MTKGYIPAQNTLFQINHLHERWFTMRKIIFKSIILLCIAVMISTSSFCTSAPAAERELGQPTPGNTFIDALIYRPIGLAAIPLGTVLFIVTLPFSATGGNIGQSFDNLIMAPAKYTFARPLGDI